MRVEVKMRFLIFLILIIILPPAGRTGRTRKKVGRETSTLKALSKAQAEIQTHAAAMREKKSKGDAEKMKRKIEGDLKLTQEAVSDLERTISELGQSVQRREKEISSIGAKIEDEQTLGSKYSKQVKELQVRVDELDEEINVERGNRGKAEKNRGLLSGDLEDIDTRLEQAGSNTALQIDLNKKRESELAKLKADLEETRNASSELFRVKSATDESEESEEGEEIDRRTR